MKRDLLFLILIITASATALLDLSYLIYLFINIAAMGNRFHAAAPFFPFSLAVTAINVLTATFAVVYFVFKRRA